MRYFTTKAAFLTVLIFSSLGLSVSESQAGPPTTTYNPGTYTYYSGNTNGTVAVTNYTNASGFGTGYSYSSVQTNSTPQCSFYNESMTPYTCGQTMSNCPTGQMTLFERIPGSSTMCRRVCYRPAANCGSGGSGGGGSTAAQTCELQVSATWRRTSGNGNGNCSVVWLAREVSNSTGYTNLENSSAAFYNTKAQCLAWATNKKNSGAACATNAAPNKNYHGTLTDMTYIPYSEQQL